MKAQYLYDTNIISEIMRPKPNSGVVRQFTRPQVLGISTVTIEEIIFGLNLKLH
jgi:toxin FitB